MSEEKPLSGRAGLEKAIIDYFKTVTGKPISAEEASKIAEKLVPTKNEK